MAVDQTSIALDIAERMVQQVTKFLNALAELEEETAHADESLIDFNTFDADFAASSDLQHIDGGYLNKLKNDVVPGIRGYIDVTTSGTKTYERVLYEIKR